MQVIDIMRIYPILERLFNKDYIKIIKNNKEEMVLLNLKNESMLKIKKHNLHS